MDKLYLLGMFFLGLGVFLGGIGFLWWISVYEKIHSKKQ